MSSQQFSGDHYDFAVGSIKGMRDWEVDSQGRLVGVTHAIIWRPGENVALCRQRTPCPIRFNSDGLSVFYYDEPTLGPRRIGEAPKDQKPEECKVEGCADGFHPTDHTFDASCECGFWAYDEDSHKPLGSITGIVEAYGKVTVGTLGFRAEKAKVVALARQHEDHNVSLSKWLRLQQLYPDVAFYDDLDEMVTAHGAVLKTWDTPGEEFWNELPPPVPVDWTTRYMMQAFTSFNPFSVGGFIPSRPPVPSAPASAQVTVTGRKSLPPLNVQRRGSLTRRLRGGL